MQITKGLMALSYVNEHGFQTQVKRKVNLKQIQTKPFKRANFITKQRHQRFRTQGDDEVNSGTFESPGTKKGKALFAKDGDSSQTQARGRQSSTKTKKADSSHHDQIDESILLTKTRDSRQSSKKVKKRSTLDQMYRSAKKKA